MREGVLSLTAGAPFSCCGYQAVYRRTAREEVVDCEDHRDQYRGDQDTADQAF